MYNLRFRHALISAALVTVTVSAQDALTPVDRSTEALEGLLVTADEKRIDYVVPTSPSLLKLDVPILEMPQTATVVPKEVIKEQGAQTLKDVYRNISGVFESGNTLNAQSEVLPMIRGFEAPSVFRNGMRATQVGSVDLFNIESVEVLKGPASILFGGLEPGGVLNFTTKKPLAESFHEIE